MGWLSVELMRLDLQAWQGLVGNALQSMAHEVGTTQNEGGLKVGWL